MSVSEKLGRAPLDSISSSKHAPISKQDLRLVFATFESPRPNCICDDGGYSIPLSGRASKAGALRRSDISWFGFFVLRSRAHTKLSRWEHHVDSHLRTIPSRRYLFVTVVRPCRRVASMRGPALLRRLCLGPASVRPPYNAAMILLPHVHAAAWRGPGRPLTGR